MTIPSTRIRHSGWTSCSNTVNRRPTGRAVVPVGEVIVCNGLGRGTVAILRFGETGGDPVLVDVPFRGGEPVRVVFVVLEQGLTGRGIAGTFSNRFNPVVGR